ncbi:MAG: hypothetical protein RLZZ300_2357 [Pseudomonadota bacterium]
MSSAEATTTRMVWPCSGAPASSKLMSEPDQGEVHGNRNDEQDQRRGAGQRLEGDAVDHRPERHDEQHGEDNLCPQRHLAGRHGEQPGGGQQRHADVGDEQGRQLGIATIAQQPVAVEQRDGGAQAEQQPDCTGHLASLQRSQGQRAESDEFALRNEDDAGDGEDEDQREGEQRIDGAVGDAILAEKEKNLEVHATLKNGRAVSNPPQRRQDAKKTQRQVFFLWFSWQNLGALAPSRWGFLTWKLT